MEKSRTPTFICTACDGDLFDHVCPGLSTISERADQLNNLSLDEFFQLDAGPKGDCLYFVLLERYIENDPSDLFGGGRRVKAWGFAYTKAFARTIARRARDAGWNVVDISKGTKKHLSYKFRRL